MPRKAKRKSNLVLHSASANASREKRSRERDDSREERLKSIRLRNNNRRENETDSNSPCYAMTLEKSQGQSFEKLVYFSQNPYFSHGQLYVAFSRARSFDDIKVSIIEGVTQGSSGNKLYTRNVVYPHVLNIENCDSSRPEFIRPSQQ